jgi:hypothetical protein
VLEVIGGAEHADAVEAEVALARIVVEQPDRRVSERRVALHLLHDELARVAGPDDDRLLAAADDPAGQGPLDERPCEEPRSGDERHAEQQVDEPDAARDGHAVDVEQREDEEDRDRGEHDASERRPHVARRDVAPPAVVEAGEREDRELDADDEDHDRPLEVTVVVDRAHLIEAEAPREPPRPGDEQRVDADLPDRVAVDRAAHEAPRSRRRRRRRISR